MTRICDESHFKKCLLKAIEVNELDSFLEKIFRYTDDVMKRVDVFQDCSFNQEYNFGFTIYTKQMETQNWSYWYNGGIIFDGKKWNIHT